MTYEEAYNLIDPANPKETHDFAFGGKKYVILGVEVDPTKPIVIMDLLPHSITFDDYKDILHTKELEQTPQPSDEELIKFAKEQMPEWQEWEQAQLEIENIKNSLELTQ